MKSLLSYSRRPDVTFYPQGRIDISSRIARQLKLGQGDVIDVAEHRGEYLLYVRHKAENLVGRHEASVYPTNHGKCRSYHFRAYSRRLTDAIFQIANTSDEEKPLRLPAGLVVDTESVGLAVPLITRNPI